MAEANGQKPSCFEAEAAVGDGAVAAPAETVADFRRRVCEVRYGALRRPLCEVGFVCRCQGKVFTVDDATGVFTLLSHFVRWEVAQAEADQGKRVARLVKYSCPDHPNEAWLDSIAGEYFCRKCPWSYKPPCEDFDKVLPGSPPAPLERVEDEPESAPDGEQPASVDDAWGALAANLRAAGLPEAAGQLEGLVRMLAERAEPPKLAGSNLDLVTAALSPVDFAIAAAERQMLSLGVPVEILIRWAMQHAASLCAVIPNPAVRAQLMKQAIGNFPTQVRNAVVTSRTTTGGIIMPGGAPR